MSISGVGMQPGVAFTSNYKPSEKKTFAPLSQEQVEQNKKSSRKKAILIAGGLALAAGAVWFFTKGKGMDKLKKLWQTLKGKFGGKTEEVVKEVTQKAKKAKVKTQAATVAEHVNLVPGQKVKMSGKDAIHKVRRNKKAIIEATRLREEAERFTEKELQQYAKSIAYQAPTAEQAAIIAEKHSKPAVNTIGDFMQAQGISRVKEPVSGAVTRVALKKEPVQAAAQAATQAAETVVDKAARIAELQAKVAKYEEQIARYQAPGMTRWAKPLESSKAKLLQEIERLQGKAPEVAQKAAAIVKPNVTAAQKAAQVEKAWAQVAPKTPVVPTAPKVPTSAEIFAKAEAEAAKMAKDEAEALKAMGF